MTLKSSLIALALTLTCLQAHQASAAQLMASFVVQSFDYLGILTERDWATNSSSAPSVSHADGISDATGSTRASYGDLRVALTSYSHVDALDSIETHTAGTGVQASWSDTVTISNALLNGTTGYLRPAILYSGYVHVTGATDGNGSVSLINFDLSDFADGPTDLTMIGELDTGNSPKTVNINTDAAGLAASNGLPNLDIQFVYGQPFTLSAMLYLNSGGAGAGTYTDDSQLGFTKLRWQGAQVFDANTNLVTHFTLTSESGTDWAISQGGVVAAPQITGLNILNMTNLVLNGTGGLLADPVALLTATNVTLPMTNWVHLNTNAFDYLGQVSFTNAMSPGEPQRYFRLQAL